MAEPTRILVPDLGDFDSVDVVEVLVSPGEHVDVEAGLITLESDKASMEVPSTHSGVVLEVAVSLGDKVAEGDLIVVLDAEDESHPDQRVERPRHPHAPAPASGRSAFEEAGAGSQEPASPRPAMTAAGPVVAAPRDVDAEVLVLGAGPGGTPPPSAPPTWVARSFSWSRTRASAACASMSAASRPRRCFTPPA